MNSNLFEMNILFDYYGPLLTGKQVDIFKMYYMNDYSLGEISKELKISRQGVYDTLKRAEITLKYYEEKLGLIKKNHILNKRLSRIKHILEITKCLTDNKKIIDMIDKAITELETIDD